MTNNDMVFCNQANMQLRTFTHKNAEIPGFLGANNELWFIASDIAKLLEYRDANNAIRVLDDDEKGTHIVSTFRGPQKLAIINESGLYFLILMSRKPEVKRYKLLGPKGPSFRTRLTA